MIKLLFIGLGQAGNTIAGLVAGESIKSLAINSSELDLLSIKTGNPNFLTTQEIKLNERNGCGGERTISRKIIKEKIETLVSRHKKDIDEADLVIVCGATGGGFGSGSVPILSGILKNAMRCNVMTIGIMPRVNDAVQANDNTNGFMLDFINMIPDGSLFLVDNNTFNVESIDVVHQRINKSVVDLVKFINGDFTNGIASKSVIDDNDKLRAVLEPGCGMFATLQSKQSTEMVDSETTLLEMMNTSSFAITEKGVIPNILTMYNMNTCNTSKEKLQNRYGSPIFEKNHINDSLDEELPSIIVLATGFNLPAERINIGKKTANMAKEKKKNNNNESVLSLLLKEENDDTINTNALIESNMDDTDEHGLTDVNQSISDCLSNWNI